MTSGRLGVALAVRLDRAIEALWLFAIVGIPIAFRGREWVAIFSQPKFLVLHFSALSIAILWFAQLAVESRASTVDSGNVIDRADRWIRQDRARWAVVAAGLFGVAVVASTMLSPLPSISLLGRNFEDLGYDAYSTLSYLVIFGAIAVRLRSRDQATRLAMAIAAAGVIIGLYGVSQHFGWDPIGRESNASRVLSSLGNPLFLGQFLLMSTLITLGVGQILRKPHGRKWLLPATALAVGIQLAALWFTGGRGPWMGTTIGLVAFGLLGLKWLQRDALRWLVMSAGGGIAIAAVLAFVPADANTSARGIGSLLDIPGEVVDAVGFMFGKEDADLIKLGAVTAILPSTSIPDPDQPLTESLNPDVVRSLSTLGTFGFGDARSSALTGRSEIWRTSFRLLGSRDTVDDESTAVSALRHLFGFGPDMYFYSYGISADPQSQFIGVSHAHNYVLQIWVELGVLGMATIISVIGIAIYSVVKVAGNRDLDTGVRVLSLAVLAALIGRAVEQSVGVARVSDLVLFFAILGFAVALSRIADSADDSRGSARASRRSRTEIARGKGYAGLAGVGVAAVAATFIFVSSDVQQLRAGRAAADAFEQQSRNSTDEAFRSFERSVKLAPEVERYSLELADILMRTAVARASEDPDRAVELLLAAHGALTGYEDRDPFAWDTQLRLASVTTQLVTIGRSEFQQESVERQIFVAELMPAYPAVQALVAENLIALGEFQAAVFAADRAIIMESATTRRPGAWWARGEALYLLGRFEEAKNSFATSTERANLGYSPEFDRYQHLSYLRLETFARQDGLTDLANYYNYSNRANVPQ